MAKAATRTPMVRAVVRWTAVAGLLCVALSSSARRGCRVDVSSGWLPAATSTLRRSAGKHDTNNNIDEDPMLRHILKRSGELWSVWDRKSVLHADAGSTCHWREFRAAHLPPGEGHRAPSHMCLYPRNQDIYVSGSIEAHGRWSNCDRLTRYLAGTRRATYVDIGANIGACVMQVLLTTDAHVVAFEPTPKNLFHLTSTLLNLPGHLRDRVTLFPVALGDRETVSTVMTSPTNAGNTQLKRTENEVGIDGATNETHNIPVERVDDLLGPELAVEVIKMDVQGYECFVVDGMTRLLEKTHKVMFEVEKNLYERFVGNDACYGSRLVKTLQLSRFRITSEKGQLIQDLTPLSGDELKGVEFDYQDMFGVKRGPRQQ